MNLIKILFEVVQLKPVRIRLGDTPEARKIRRDYCRPHPRYLIIRNKTLGAELIRLFDFTSAATYLESVNGKNSAAYFSRKASKKGYTVSQFDPNRDPDAIYQVNISKAVRQGQEMSLGYRVREESFSCDVNHPYFGVFAPNGTLAGYVSILEFEEIAIINRILGHGEYLDDGVMYLLGTQLISYYIELKKVKYLMYDMYFGAREGLKLYKKRLGFRPYRAIWL